MYGLYTFYSTHCESGPFLGVHILDLYSHASCFTSVFPMGCMWLTCDKLFLNDHRPCRVALRFLHGPFGCGSGLGIHLQALKPHWGTEAFLLTLERRLCWVAALSPCMLSVSGAMGTANSERAHCAFPQSRHTLSRIFHRGRGWAAEIHNTLCGANSTLRKWDQHDEC